MENKQNINEVLNSLISTLEREKKECPNHNPEERIECYGYDENYNSALETAITLIKEKIQR